MAKLTGPTKKFVTTLAAIGTTTTVGAATIMGTTDMNWVQRKSLVPTFEESTDVSVKWNFDFDVMRDDTAVDSDSSSTANSAYVGTGEIPELFKDYIPAGSIGKTRAKILANAASQVGHCGYLWNAMQPWSAIMSSCGWFDCSHFQYWCYTNNITVNLQSGYSNCRALLASSEYKQIPLNEAKPGDLLVCSGHVMMFLGYTKDASGRLVTVDCGGGDSTTSYPPTLKNKSFDNVENYYSKGVRFKPTALLLETVPGVPIIVGNGDYIDNRQYKVLQNIKLAELDEAERVANAYSDNPNNSSGNTLKYDQNVYNVLASSGYASKAKVMAAFYYYAKEKSMPFHTICGFLGNINNEANAAQLENMSHSTGFGYLKNMSDADREEILALINDIKGNSLAIDSTTLPHPPTTVEAHEWLERWIKASAYDNVNKVGAETGFGVGMAQMSFYNRRGAILNAYSALAGGYREDDMIYAEIMQIFDEIFDGGEQFKYLVASDYRVAYKIACSKENAYDAGYYLAEEYEKCNSRNGAEYIERGNDAQNIYNVLTAAGIN